MLLVAEAFHPTFHFHSVLPPRKKIGLGAESPESVKFVTLWLDLGK